jgi:pimeloyl-ACP methyl ester carboxylesterase
MKRRRVLMVTLVFAIGLAMLAAAGLLYETLRERSDAHRFPAPGTMVDVGGRRLHLICEGAGVPTVIFEASGLGTALSSDAVRAEVRVRAKACAYDRMGLGWSDPGPREISVRQLADDLLHLHERAGLGPPYILVASSVGGLTVEMFARRHPEQVSGLVFVDAADSGMLEYAASRFGALAREAPCLASAGARVGVLRLIDPLNIRGANSEAAVRTAALTYRQQPWATLCGMSRGLPRTIQEFRAAPPLPPDLPLRVLTHDTPTGLLPPAWNSTAEAFDPEWRDLQQRLSRRSNRGTWRVVPGSDHLIAGSQPHAVAEAVLELLDAISR